jgi:hypothetical protein
MAPIGAGRRAAFWFPTKRTTITQPPSGGGPACPPVNQRRRSRGRLRRLGQSTSERAFADPVIRDQLAERVAGCADRWYCVPAEWRLKISRACLCC